ncbi:MAG: glycoside hydrolase family 3 protein [Spirochaetes bacterium]|nr:glycoside hydrolase family 3 protein [Spirochaetota bacterium]
MKTKHLIFFLVLSLLFSCAQKSAYLFLNESVTDKLDKDEKRIHQMIIKVLDKMSLDEMAAQMIISYPDKDIIEMGIGGVILFHHHIHDEDSVKKLIQNYNQWSDIPLLVMLDQEGGQVNPLKNMGRYKRMPSARRMAGWDDSRILQYNRKLGDYLKGLRINMVLAPCLDVSSPGSLMHKLQRSFSDQPLVVKRKGGAFASGLYNDMIVIGKHFPGYGEARMNSDISLVHYEINEQQLDEYVDVYKDVSEYLDGIMMSSIIYKNNSVKPAVFSEEFVARARKILPHGLIITDDIQARSIRDFIRKYLKENDLTIENETIVQSKKSPYCWPFTVSEIKFIVDMAFDAGLTQLLTLDPLKAIYIKHFIKEKVQDNPEDLKKLKHNVYLVLRKKIKVYPQYFIDEKFLALKEATDRE